MTNGNALMVKKVATSVAEFIVVLPRELTAEQCNQAVGKFCRDETSDQMTLHFALHLEPDQQPEQHLPNSDRHAHIRLEYATTDRKERTHLLARDMGLKWNAEMSLALERAGHVAKKEHRYTCILRNDPMPSNHR